MADDGFHEIQLNGKQLVFLFMATTVVAVVIFLCGVMVGRGVPAAPASALEMADEAGLDPTANPEAPVAIEAVASAGRAPLTAGETLTYPTLLGDPNPPDDTLKPVVEPVPDVPMKAPAAVAVPRAAAAKPPAAMTTPQATAVKPSVATTPQATAMKPPVALKVPQATAAKPPAAAVVQPSSPRPVARPALSTPAAIPEPRVGVLVPSTPAASRPVAVAPAVTTKAALPEPTGSGFVVQVAAVRERDQADIIVRRLASKGYPAFVTTSGANFRVRVGKYDDRQEAEAVAGRLEREERFKPWITR